MAKANRMGDVVQRRQDVADFVDEVLLVWGEEMEAGENLDVHHMMHMWEPLRVLPKPLVVHMFSEVAAICLRCVLWRRGFHHLRHQVG